MGCQGGQGPRTHDLQRQFEGTWFTEFVKEEAKGSSNCSPQKLENSHKDSGTSVFLVERGGTERFCGNRLWLGSCSKSEC